MASRSFTRSFHGLLIAGTKVIGVGIKRCPHGAGVGSGCTFVPAENHAAVCLGLQTKVLFVPTLQCLGILSSEKHAADARCPFHYRATL